MSRRDEPFIEVYWRLEDEYPETWDDDQSLAWYVRLMKLAEGLWPSAPSIPSGIPAKVWKSLTRPDGLVIPEPDGRRYRMRGLDAKRNARSNAARNAARSRWGNADGNPGASDDRMPHSRAKQSTPHHTNGARDPMASTGELDEALLSWMQRTHQVTVRPGNGWHLRIIDWFRQGISFDAAKDAVTAAVEDGGRLDRQVIPAAEDVLFPRREPERLTPRERRDRDIADTAARIRAEAAAAKAAQA